MKNSLLITNARIFQNHQFVEGCVLVQNGRIQEVCPLKLNEAIPKSLQKAAEGLLVMDAQGQYLVPGFIDVHTHGAAGVDVNAASVEDLKKIASFFASQGTTSWNASVLTDTKEQTLWCINQLKQLHENDRLTACENVDGRATGAELLGVHLEGPFLSKEYKGAMPEVLLKDGDAALFREFFEASEGLISYITVAPEVPGVVNMIREIASDVNVAIGHSAASYEESWEAIWAGARSCTHTFNAMKLFHQHFPAIMGAVLESDIYAEAICDGRHLHPGTVRMLLKCKGFDKVVAITDSIMAAGLPDGEYKLGVNDVIVKDGDAKLKNGVRAGSTLTQQTALKNILTFTGCTLEEALPLLTENPAELMRVGKKEHSDRPYAKGRQKGYLLPGFDADLVLLNENCDVVATMVHGAVVYQKNGKETIS